MSWGWHQATFLAWSEVNAGLQTSWQQGSPTTTGLRPTHSLQQQGEYLTTLCECFCFTRRRLLSCDESTATQDRRLGDIYAT